MIIASRYFFSKNNYKLCKDKFINNRHREQYC